MAQECMSIFEKQKLPAAASVEQVPLFSAFFQLITELSFTELCHGDDSRRENAEAPSGRDGPAAGQSRNQVSSIADFFRMASRSSCLQ